MADPYIFSMSPGGTREGECGADAKKGGTPLTAYGSWASVSRYCTVWCNSPDCVEVSTVVGASEVWPGCDST